MRNMKSSAQRIRFITSVLPIVVIGARQAERTWAGGARGGAWGGGEGEKSERIALFLALFFFTPTKQQGYIIADKI